MVAASVRLPTSSLARMSETCTLAVLVLMNRRVGDLPVGASLGDQGEHLAFPLGEPESGRRGGVGRWRPGSGWARRAGAAFRGQRRSWTVTA